MGVLGQSRWSDACSIDGKMEDEDFIIRRSTLCSGPRVEDTSNGIELSPIGSKASCAAKSLPRPRLTVTMMLERPASTDLLLFRSEFIHEERLAEEDTESTTGTFV